MGLPAVRAYRCCEHRSNMYTRNGDRPFKTVKKSIDFRGPGPHMAMMAIVVTFSSLIFSEEPEGTLIPNIHELKTGSAARPGRP